MIFRQYSKKRIVKTYSIAKKSIILYRVSQKGGLAQLARALAWHARGHRFEPDILHTTRQERSNSFLFFCVRCGGVVRSTQ